MDIIRPREPAAHHQTIPAIMDTSGYYQSYGRGNEDPIKTYDQHGKPVQFPLFLDNYFVPRGYAVVLPDLAGTNRSTGCTDLGGPSELAFSTRVIDWMNGRAPGYSSPLGDKQVNATWASGSVGMIGKSWDGQNVLETAVTGIKGLDAVVPEGGISSDWTQFYLRTGTNDYLLCRCRRAAVLAAVAPRASFTAQAHRRWGDGWFRSCLGFRVAAIVKCFGFRGG